MATPAPRTARSKRSIAGIVAGTVLVGLLVISIGIAVVLNGMDQGNHDAIVRTPPAKEPCLRSIARKAPAGGAAYYLGAVFRGAAAKPQYGCGWQRWNALHSEIAYFTPSAHPNAEPPDNLIVIVFTVPRDNTSVARFYTGVSSRMHVTDRQDVVLVFQRAKPSADVIRETRAAVQPIPR